MKKYMGIWVDHKNAYIATLEKPTLPQEEISETIFVEHLASQVDRCTRLPGDSRSRKKPWGPQEVVVDSKIEERQKHQLRRFYAQLIDMLKAADKILIIGPGQAKYELHKQIERSSKEMTKRIFGVETRDKMTERQIAAWVRTIFDHERKEGARPVAKWQYKI